MNLVIDIGNSQTKYAIFRGSEPEHITASVKPDLEVLRRLANEFGRAGHAMLSPATKPSGSFVRQLGNFSKHLMVLSHETPIPVRNAYQSRQTLGKDRIAGAVGAATLFPGKDVLIIDAGTAITFDYLSQRRGYCGGNISPGLRMRFKALHAFTESLPLLDPVENWPEQGNDTASSIRAGILQGILFEMRAYIGEYKAKYPGIRIVLTGGDAGFFDKKLKNGIFVFSNLVLIGLNRILEYNVKEH